MGFRRSFHVGLAWRVALLLGTAFLLVQSFGVDGIGAARIVAAAMFVGAVASLWHYVQSTNRDLARFVEAIRFGDLSQNFGGREGGGFNEIGRALEDSIRRLREERHRLTSDTHFYEAVLDDAPTALLIVDAEGRVELGNKAARRLLVRHSGVRVDDFRAYGEAFANSLGESSVGRPRLVPLVIDGAPQAAMISAAVVHRLGGLVRVVAVQPIQGELNAVEITAQSDLIRVLTHEIMNSMTPVTSLAHTAAELVAQADTGASRDIKDARAAVETLARRADGIMNFVRSYRQISRAPDVRRRAFKVAEWAEELKALFLADTPTPGVEFTLRVEPPGLALDADPDLMAQVLINLLRNGAQAAASNAKPAVSLSFARTSGGRVSIEVKDNGPGVPETLRQDIFLPFFTTKQQGTGVGLSLARQVVLAHQGSIDLTNRDGALFRIVI